MIKKTLFFALSFLMVFSLCSFAGEGSDTIGGGKLLPQLRYGYSVTGWETDSPAAGPYSNWETKAHDYYAQVNWGILNNVDLIALIGGRAVSSESETSFGFETRTGSVPMFLWGVGVKATFFRADNGFYVGGGALFTNSFSGKYSRKVYDDGDFEFETSKIYSRSIYKLVPELHVGWNFKDIGLTPYMGVDYVYARSTTEIDGDNREIVNVLDNPVYMFVGLDYFLNDKLYINVEGRGNFVDGWGVETGVGYLFDLCAPAPAPEVIPPPVIEPKLEPMSKN